MPSKAESVTSRLTDTTKYTGSHKERFDDSGKGKGKAGRENLVKVDGSTSSASRDHTITRDSNQSLNGGKSSSTTGSRPILNEKFTIQVEKPISITLYRNGDKNHEGYKVLIKNFKTLDQLLAKATENVKLPTGPVKKIYDAGLKKTVKSLDEFQDGGCYLCCSGEQPSLERLSEGFKKGSLSQLNN